MAVCLVIGGAGFIGSHLVEALLEEDHVVRAMDNFTTGSLTKLAEERACILAGSLYGLETVRLRYFNVYGPRQPRDGPDATVLLQTVEAMLSGRPPVIAGSPFSAQDLICIDDIVHATLLAAE